MFPVEPLGSFSTATSSPSTGSSSPRVKTDGNRFSQRPYGLSRGIQGKNNSCYVDVAIMAMFGFNELFDTLLTAAPAPLTASSTSTLSVMSQRSARVISADATIFFQRFLTLMVVNPLRKNGFVPFAHVMTLRSMLSELLDGTQGDQFVHQAVSEDVNVFLERLEQVLSGGPGLGSSPSATPQGHFLAQQAQQLLNVAVAIAPVMEPLTNKRKTVVSVEEILRANTMYPACGSAQYQYPFWVNVPRSENGQLPYHMIFPTLWLAELPSTAADAKTQQQPSPCCHLELSAIITFDVTIQHYCALLKVPQKGDSGSRSTWVEYDSMGGAELNEAINSTEQVPRISPAGSMGIFEACAYNPVLQKICCDMCTSDDFTEFMYRAVGSPSRANSSSIGGDGGVVDDVNEWSIFRQAVRRPYLYLYMPKSGPVPPQSLNSTPPLHLSKVDDRHIEYLTTALKREVFAKRSWREALRYWAENDVAQCLPPPPTFGCPDCDATFEDESSFVQHMRKGCSSDNVTRPPPPPPPPPSTAAPSSATLHTSSRDAYPLSPEISTNLTPYVSANSRFDSGAAYGSSGGSVTYFPSALSPERSHQQPTTLAEPLHRHYVVAEPREHLHGSSGHRREGDAYNLATRIEPPAAQVRAKTLLPRQAAAILTHETRDTIRCNLCKQWLPIERLKMHQCWEQRR